MMAFESLLPMALLAADAPAAWFPNNGVVGAVAGSSLGLVGGILGPLAGILAPRGLCRGFVMGTFVSLAAAAAVLACVGLVALALGQPFHVWFSLFLPGALGAMVLGVLTPVVRLRYRQAEMLKLEGRLLSGGG